MADMTRETAAGTAIDTERLAIRPWRVQEADRFFDIHRRIEVVRWLGRRALRSSAIAAA